MLHGAAIACQRFGIDFLGGVPAQSIFLEIIREEIGRRLQA
jgi:hypothetical protein